ncbi:lysophospholipase [Zhongshania guokunii]|uniref:Lysophospholipase n=1 Tax=Zhongshania guokunii TaxID=641783 RepID=A0ABV3U3J2_9GAMM
MKQGNGKFRGCEGIKVFWQCWHAENPVAVMIVAHGLGEHGGRYAELAHALVAKNITVYAIDHRGHGQSYGHRGAINRFQYCIEDLDQLVDKVTEEHKLPLLLLGHSMGGAISVGYTLQHQDKLSALLLSGAALASDVVNAPVKALCGLISVFAPNLPAFAVAPELVSRDPAAVADYSADPLNLSSRVPLKTISEMVNTIAKLPPQFERIRLPIFIMHGSDDKLIPAAASEAFNAKISSTDKQLKIYPGLYHEILNELPEDRRQVVSDIVAWVSERYPAA